MKDKSDENWKVGQQCLAQGDANAAASRLYYGVFQAVLDWARRKQDYPTGRTDGVHAKMGCYVRRGGMQSRFYGGKFAELQSLRETADYAPEPVTVEDLRDLEADCAKIRDHYLNKAATP